MVLFFNDVDGMGVKVAKSTLLFRRHQCLLPAAAQFHDAAGTVSGGTKNERVVARRWVRWKKGGSLFDFFFFDRFSSFC